MSIFPEHFNKTNPEHWLAFGLGSGLSPKAPGTAGTLLAIPFYIALAHLSLPLFALCILLAALWGIRLCGKTASDLGVHDHGGIVWDEFVGFWVTMLAIPLGWPWIVAGFILFRFFDIVKPWPIKWLDSKVSGGLGIMIDDIVAGVFANLVLQLAAWYLV